MHHRCIIFFSDTLCPYQDGKHIPHISAYRATDYGGTLYSRNPILEQELDRLARADHTGGISVGVATSFVGDLGGTTGK